MRELPSGTVTFLFTDVEGSTRLLHEFGDEYAQVLAEHRRVLRDAFERHGGVEVDTQGDAFFVAFSKASAALAAVEEGRGALERGPIKVRMGVHTGEPLVTERAMWASMFIEPLESPPPDRVVRSSSRSRHVISPLGLACATWASTGSRT